MAYENESKRVLASKARFFLNAAENSIQSGMRRLDELERRYAGEEANTTPVPIANTTPTPPVANTTPAPTPPVANTGWVKASEIPLVLRNFDVNSFLRDSTIGYKVPVGELAAMRISQPHIAISRVDPFFKVAEGDHTHDVFNRSNIPASGDYKDLIESNNAQGEGRLINASFYALGSLMVQDMNDKWHNLIARYSIFYYKHDAPENPIWNNKMLKRVDFPRGLKLLGGIRHYREPANWSKVSSDPMYNCPS